MGQCSISRDDDKDKKVSRKEASQSVISTTHNSQTSYNSRTASMSDAEVHMEENDGEYSRSGQANEVVVPKLNFGGIKSHGNFQRNLPNVDLSTGRGDDDDIGDLYDEEEDQNSEYFQSTAVKQHTPVAAPSKPKRPHYSQPTTAAIMKSKRASQQSNKEILATQILSKRSNSKSGDKLSGRK